MLAGCVRLAHGRVEAEGLQCRAGRRPHEVRPADAGVPEIPQAFGDVLLHLRQHPGVPARPRRRRALPADQPDGGGKPPPRTATVAGSASRSGSARSRRRRSRRGSRQRPRVSQASGDMLANTTPSRPLSGFKRRRGQALKAPRHPVLVVALRRLPVAAEAAGVVDQFAVIYVRIPFRTERFGEDGVDLA